jgi:hypothetical protein
MNSSPSSSLVVLAVVVLAAVAVPVAAVSVSDSGVPQTVETDETVGVERDVTFTLSDLYTDYQSYELAGSTDLRSAVWTVTTLDPQGDTIETRTFDSDSFTIDVGGSVNAVEVSVEGRAPSADDVDFSYDPPQAFVIAAFSQRQSGGVATEIETITARPYTSDSEEARSAIDDASQAVDDASSAGASTDEAERLLGNAIDAFDNGDFALAIDLADQAESSATSAQESQEQTQLLLTAGAVLIALVIVGAGLYWYLQNRGPADKLG